MKHEALQVSIQKYGAIFEVKEDSCKGNRIVETNNASKYSWTKTAYKLTTNQLGKVSLSVETYHLDSDEY